MNGAQALIRTLVASGVDTCFANPGTSEMHFVAALDTVPEMQGVLALFEGVATGAADGYARMSGRPAATLLHLGPGLGNGLANLHNAKKASSVGTRRKRTASGSVGEVVDTFGHVHSVVSRRSSNLAETVVRRVSARMMSAC